MSVGASWQCRVSSVTALVALLLLAAAGPAVADPAVPTEYESQITGVAPATELVELEVIGGDSFLEIAVEPGHRVMVFGYGGEPYLEIDAAGVVSVNERSPSKYVNDDRFGEADVPEFASADAEPLWEVVATGGQYAWHDHRTHWMATDRPPAITGDSIQRVFLWEVPMEIDGVDHSVVGTLDWHPPPNSAAPLIGAAGVVLLLIGWRRGGVRLLGGVIAVAAIAALLLSVSQWLATPSVARVVPVAVLPPALALGLGVFAARGVTKPITAVQSVIVAAVALLAYVFISLNVFTKPLLPSFLPDGVERFATAAVAWAALGAGVVAVATMARVVSGAPETPGGAG